MEEEQKQNICNTDRRGDERLNSSPTHFTNEESPIGDKIESKHIMENLHLSNPSCTIIDKQQKLKLIVRSQYWGRELKGRTCRNVYTNMNVKSPLVITSQAVLYNTDGFWGCCPAQGKRVLELQEYHFSDACQGSLWDLYLVGTWVSPTQSIHDFFLLPRSQTSVDVERNMRLNGWSHVTTCNSYMVRSGIDEKLRGLLQQNDSYGHRYHHVHIDIMMDKAFDRETPRSRKLNNEKNRAERTKKTDSLLCNYERQESSVTTEATASTEQESPPSAASKASTVPKPFASKVVGAAPPIPRLIPNESVPYLVPSSHSMANLMVGYRDARWMGENRHWNHDPIAVSSCPGMVTDRLGHVPNGNDRKGMHWYPARSTPLPRMMPQRHSYWHNAHGAPIPMATPEPYYHLPDMQMHQYQFGMQQTHSHHLESEYQHYNMTYIENQHYTGIHDVPDNSFRVDAPMVRAGIAERSPIKFLPHSLGNISTSDCSAFPPPSEPGPSPPPSISPVPAFLDKAGVPHIAATKTPNNLPKDDSEMSRQPSSTFRNNEVESVNAPTSASTDEQLCIPAATS